MKPKEFKEQNLLLKAGDNPNTSDLNACRCTDAETKSPFIVAKFALDREEIIKINETGELWLCIMGNNWPPVLPTVFNPFKEHGFIVNKGGLPVMRFREEVDQMLKKLYWDETWMNEKWWNEFIVFMNEKFDFAEFGEQLFRAQQNGFSVEEQIQEVERVMVKIMSKDQLKNLGKN